MNKKLKKTLTVASAMIMCSVSNISASASASYIPTNQEISPETISFSAKVYNKNMQFHLWQEATDYFDDKNVKIYASDKFTNDFGEEYTYELVSYHQSYLNEYDFCGIGLLWITSYNFDNKEDKAILEKYLLDNNIKYEISNDEQISIHNTTNNEENFKILQKVKDDTGFTVDWFMADTMVEITDVENLLPEPTLTGDANDDGEVTIADAVLIMQSLSSPDDYQITPQGIANADTNGDGGITAADALVIQETLVNK